MSDKVQAAVKRALGAERKATRSKSETDYEAAAAAYNDAARLARSTGWDLDMGPNREGGQPAENRQAAKNLYELAYKLEASAKLMSEKIHKLLAMREEAKDPEKWAAHKKAVDAAIRTAQAAERKADKVGTSEAYIAAENLYDSAARLAYQGQMHKGKLAASIGSDLFKRAAKMKERAAEIRAAAYKARHEAWAARTTLVDGKPPATMNLLDANGGFTAVTKKGYGSSSYLRGQTVWRPGSLLKRGTTGTLMEFDPKSFFQTNHDVTQAIYKVPGYGYPAAVWFDNATGRRIA